VFLFHWLLFIGVYLANHPVFIHQILFQRLLEPILAPFFVIQPRNRFLAPVFCVFIAAQAA